MSDSRVIVVGTDLSDGADEAVRQAHRYCVDWGARLVVCNVIPDPLRMNMLFPQLNMEAWRIPEVVERAANAVRKRVGALTGRPDSELEVVVDVGAPEEVLVRHAEDLSAELVVVGALSRSVLRRLIGGVAERVVRHAHTSVLVARQTTETGHVLVATDFSDPALSAVEAGVAEARRRRARLHIAHCLNLVLPNVVSESTHPFAAGSGVPLAADAVERLRRDAGARMTEALRRFSTDGDQHLLDGEAGEAITDLADELHPELIVMGTVGRTGLRRLLLGSVSEYVIRNAERSTFVVRQRPALS